MRPPPNDELTSKTNRNHLLYRANTVYFEVLVFVDHLEGADKSVGTGFWILSPLARAETATIDLISILVLGYYQQVGAETSFMSQNL